VLIYEEVTPAPPLREYIECYWNLRSEKSLHQELCLPDGSVSFIYTFGKPYYRASCHEPNKWQEVTPASVTHQGKLSFLVTQEGPVFNIGVRFKPHGFSSFFRVSMNQYLSPFLIQQDSLFTIMNELSSGLSHFSSFEDVVELLNQILCDHLPKAGATDELVNMAVKEMVRNAGNLRITELHEQLCVSKSTLEKRFQEHVGLSPKILCNILRFNSIVYQGQKEPAPSLTQLTYQQGFFDQSHLVHNFRSFTGLPPGRFFRQNHRLVEMLRQSFEKRRKEIY